MYDDYHDQRVAGVVTIDGEDILGSDVALGVLRRRVGMVFQTATVFPMSIFDNVAFGIKLERALSHQDLLARVEVALTRAALWNEV